MKLSDFDYNLPKDLVAQEPVSPRDTSRLLIYNKGSKIIEHKFFYNITDYLKPGDVLFVNNSKVFSARLKAHKKTGGQIEIFLLKNIDKNENVWECLLGGKIKDSQELDLAKKLKAQVIKNDNGIWQVSFNKKYPDFLKIIEKIGETPLPPYIKREGQSKKDIKNYQTVYASDNMLGSVAAPTAGLHFTNKLLKEIKAKGVKILEGTLHVGLGTFLPIKTENIKEHHMHSEEVEVSAKTISEIIKAKKEGRRIIAVGTTSVRILENLSTYLDGHKVPKNNLKFSTDIFIYPGYKFKVIDGLITNFHLPKSSLLLLVSALIGQKNTLETYQTAINKKYRFFSYGDAMFII